MAVERGTRIGCIRLPIDRLHVELTSHCNFSCEFCADRRMRRPRGTMPLDRVARILEEAGTCRIARQVHFHVMGEPLLYPELAQTIRLAGTHGLEAWITTNGALLSPRALEELRRAGLPHLTISVQTPDAGSFALRGAQSFSFEEYRDRIVTVVRQILDDPEGPGLTLGFFSSPLARYLAPDPPKERMADTNRELRRHLANWAAWILEGSPREADLPQVLARIRKAGIFKENRIPLSPRTAFRIRILGNWASHFELPISGARIGYCPGIVENFGILWNGDYVICCTDYDGNTAAANVDAVSIREYLALPAVQAIAKGFRKFRVVHPHCRLCLGEVRPLHSLVRQSGSIFYFKLYRKLFPGPA